jgi:hypothetical protein
MDVTTVVLTHRLPQDRPAADENFVFVTGGIEQAVETAKKIAGRPDPLQRDVQRQVHQGTRTSASTAIRWQASASTRRAGRDLRRPGGGDPRRRHLRSSAPLGVTPVQLEGPISVVEGIGVTHFS